MSTEDDDLAAFTAALRAVEGPFALHLDVCDAVTLIASLQLACRHPGNQGPTRRRAEEIARAVQDEIGRQSPEAARILERGWHQVFDVEADR